MQRGCVTHQFNQVIQMIAVEVGPHKRDAWARKLIDMAGGDEGTIANPLQHPQTALNKRAAWDLQKYFRYIENSVAIKIAEQRDAATVVTKEIVAWLLLEGPVGTAEVNRHGSRRELDEIVEIGINRLN